MNYLTGDIRTHPRILLQSEYQLVNNFQRLQEVGFANVTAYRLAYCRKIMAKSVEFNQSFNFLPKNINVIENVFNVANVPINSDNPIAYDNEMQLEGVHRLALRGYFLNQIKYTDLEIDEIWYHFPSLKTRSLQSIVAVVRLLESAYNSPVKKMPKYVLNMQPEEIQELLNSETASGIDIRDIITIAPKCNLARINEIQIICWSFKVPDYAIAFSPKLFLMAPDTLKERLSILSKLRRANEFLRHVAVGRLILKMGRINSHISSKNMNFNAVFNDTFVE